MVCYGYNVIQTPDQMVYGYILAWSSNSDVTMGKLPPFPVLRALFSNMLY